MECTPEVRRIEMQRGDVGIIFASDGLWDVLSDSTAVNLLEEASAPAAPEPLKCKMYNSIPEPPCTLGMHHGAPMVSNIALACTVALVIVSVH